jgi:hypothetical protein
MDILRIIKKNVINIANNNSKTSDVDILKKNIKEYFGHIADKSSIDSQKREKYYNKCENARVIANIEYDNFLRDKEILMNELKVEKNKAALHEYLKLKYTGDNIPDLYSYQNIQLVDRVIVPRVIDKKPGFNKPKKTKAKAKANGTNGDDECPKGKEINPVTGRCVNKCKDDEQRNQETGKCQKIKNKKKEVVSVPALVPEPAPLPEDVQDIIPDPIPAPSPVRAKPVPEKKEKECPKGKEINPVTGRCVNKCKDDEERNLETGKCKKIKK